jgi:hypothetical protein
MRKRWMVLVATVGSCGGSQKAANGPAVTSGNEDLHIPKVNPELCDPKGKKVTLFDLNHDGKPDVWKITQERNEHGTTVDALTCKEVDLNHDGKKDYVAQYDENGNLILEEYDFDFDGHFDARIHFDKKTGKKFAVERMSGFSDVPDVWEKYGPDDKLETVRRDRNGDGKPDYFEQYLAGQLDKILYDDDYDGKIDRKEEAHPERDLGFASANAAAQDAAAPADGAAKPAVPATPEPATESKAPTTPAPKPAAIKPASSKPQK